jgi:peptidoglycan hydrolase-like protein with peptidoglycan-binding domain
MSREFEPGQRSSANLRLAQALARLGYYQLGNDDDIFGRGVNRALKAFKRYHGLKTTLDDQWEQVDERTKALLFPATKGLEMGFLQKLFTPFVLTTLAKYAIAAISQYLAVKFGIDQGSIAGILAQIVTVLMASWGVGSSMQDKVVIDGTKVKIAELPPQHQREVKAIVENAKQ